MISIATIMYSMGNLEKVRGGDISVVKEDKQ